MKKSYIILISAVLLAIAVWLIEKPGEERGDLEPFLLFETFDPAKVDRVEIEHLINGTELKKEGETWKAAVISTEIEKQLAKSEGKEASAGGTEKKWFRADIAKIQNMLEIIKNAKAESIASTNPEKQGMFQVDKLGKHLRAFDPSGKIMADIYIGKSGDIYSVYVRREGENEVYLASSQLGGGIPADLLSWRDKKIWSNQPDMIVGVAISKDKESYKLAKAENGEWNLAEPKNALLGTAKVSKLLNSLTTAEAAMFASEEDTSDKGFGKPKATIEIMATDGRHETLIIGGENKEGYLFAKKDGGDEVYLLPSNFLIAAGPAWTNLLSDPEDSKDK